MCRKPISFSRSPLAFSKPVVERCFLILLVLTGYQLAAQGSANVQFKVVLSNAQSIAINQNQTNVSLVLANVAELSNGKISPQADHLQISSTSEYEITVTASSQLQGNSAQIPINTVQVSPSLGSLGGTPSVPIVFSDVNLSTNAQTLIQSDNGDLLRFFTIDYSVSGGSDYLNKPAGTYSTTITYSILPN